MLGAYHIFTADLLTGDVASLGAQTVNVARSVHGLGLSPMARGSTSPTSPATVSSPTASRAGA